WMFTGKKDKWLGVFPKPGISDEDILSAEKYGKIVLEYFKNNKLQELQEELIKDKAVELNSNILLVESRGFLMFKIWARIILKKTNRKLWINLFK
ncbi:MAG: dialkylresorcinol condensing enzyme DarA, partial [Bacteroidetes bacterium CG_4_8_14_3_um_filter_31_14]